MPPLPQALAKFPEHWGGRQIASGRYVQQERDILVATKTSLDPLLQEKRTLQFLVRKRR